MPNFDRTGPQGQGSKTGRGMGKCNPGNRNSETRKSGGLWRHNQGEETVSERPIRKRLRRSNFNQGN